LENYVSASILSADMLNLGKEIERLKENQIDMVHFDVMDGVFVNNITYGIPILKCINDITDLTLDVHLMITDPLKYVDAFAASGADIITFHLESSSDPYETIKQIHKHGIKAAIAVKPNTPAEDVFEFLPYADMILVMTVEPGFGGQSFIADTVDKIVEIKEKICELNLENVFIQVDGGIDNVTSETVKKAGANVLVSGSYLFKSKNMKEAAMLMRKKLHA
jgi:ribulose-phosphate 3-epimerase